MADGPSRVVIDEEKVTPAQGKKRKANGIQVPPKPLLFNVQSKAKDQQVIPIPMHVVDRQSILGQFGWISLGGNDLPYITRNGERYCSVKMLEKYLLPPYLDVMKPVVYKNCVTIQSYYITSWEQRLLNEINSFHCDFLFGRINFTTRDLVVRLNDLIEFYQFLVTCHSKLLNPSPSFNKFGFILIDKTSTMPFVMKDSEKHLPLFYLDGAEHLVSSSVELSGWDLGYLKLAFRVQKIRDEFIDVDKCACVPLSLVKSSFPTETVFQESWPRMINLADFISNNSEAPKPQMWFRLPVPNCK